MYLNKLIREQEKSHNILWSYFLSQSSSIRITKKYIQQINIYQLIRRMRERLDGWRAFWSEESLPTAPDTRTSVKDVGRELGLWHRNETIPCKCDDADAEFSGKMDETANPRGCKLEIGIKSSSESPDCFRKRIAECRHCKSLHDLSLHWHMAGNFAGTEGSLQASLA